MDTTAIIARAKGMITSPATEWRAVANEPTDVATLFRGYAMPLSAVPAVAGFIGSVLIGGGVLGSLVSAVLGWVFGLVGVYIIGKIAAFLAPRFGGPEDELAAMKLSVYAPTASWVASAAYVVPFLGWLVALVGGLYSLYLYYVGAPIATRVPQDRALVFTIAVIVAAIAVTLVVGAVVGTVAAVFIG